MFEGKVKTGLMGRITGNDLMNKVRYVPKPLLDQISEPTVPLLTLDSSHETLQPQHPSGERSS